MPRLLKVALLVVALTRTQEQRRARHRRGGFDRRQGGDARLNASSITITDLAVHPSTRNVFLSVARNDLASSRPAVFRIDGAGAIELVPLERVSYSRVTLPNPSRKPHRPRSIASDPQLIACYLCTPLVKVPVTALEAGGKVRGTTIAELRNMNRPLDMVACKKDGRDDILMSNNSRGVMKIPADAFGNAPPITAPVAGVRAGVRYETVPAMKGIDQLDLLDPDRAIVVARRDDAGVDLRVVPLP